jgi:4-amino-4-deoxy-L-arabinose transferase-like glycosyltransferase
MSETTQSVGEMDPQSDAHVSPFGLTSLAWMVLLLLVVTFFAAVRYRLRDMPLERDEGEYAYAGQLLLQGIPPYSLAYNMKLPGIYAAYAGILLLFGQTPAGIHLGLLLINAATTILLFFLARLLFGDLAALVAGCSYALLSTSSSVMGFEAHATNFVVLPMLAGTLVLPQAQRSRKSWRLFLSGLLFGIAVLMKQHGVFFVFFGIYLLWSDPQRRLLRKTAIFMAGVIAPYLSVCAWLYRAGVFGNFWFWTVSYAGEYSKVGLRRAIHAFVESSAVVAAPSILVWMLAAAGISALFWSPVTRRQSRFLWAMLLFSFLSLCPGAYFRVHYYILILPVCSLLAGVAVSAAWRKLAASGWPRASRFAPVIIFAICFAVSVLRQRQEYFQQAPLDVFRAIYGDNAFLPAVKIADYIRENSVPDVRIAVVGSEPEIYFYAHRHSAISYIYMYSLIVRHKYTARMREEMLRQLESNRPEFVIDVDVTDSWGDRNASQSAAFVLQLQTFLRQYELMGVVDIAEQDRYFWGPDAQHYQPGGLGAIYLYRRKAEASPQ